jgi:hypothetical protein
MWQAAAAAGSAATWESHRLERSTALASSVMAAEHTLRTTLGTAQGHVARLRDWLSSAATRQDDPAPVDAKACEADGSLPEDALAANAQEADACPAEEAMILNGREPDGEDLEGGAGREEGGDGAGVDVLMHVSATRVEELNGQLLEARTLMGRRAGALQVWALGDCDTRANAVSDKWDKAVVVEPGCDIEWVSAGVERPVQLACHLK